MSQPLYQPIKIDPATGARLDTYDDEMTEACLADWLACADEVSQDRAGSTICRIGDDWFSYVTVAE